MSTLFNLKLPQEVKAPTQHPWQKTIKDEFSPSMKYAHNSIKNPQYPLAKEKKLANNRIQFTVIGNRVTQEFNYCVHLVTGLHKYRRKFFDSPTIKGVTGVEWVSTWDDLKHQYGGIAFCLETQVAVLINGKLLGGDKELKELIGTKYIYHLVLDYHKEGVTQFVKFIRSSGRPSTYMQVSIDGIPVGTMIFMLYSDIVPLTSENFLRLNKIRKGGYSGTPVHRIVKDGWIQCGGFGLKSTELCCENFIIPHDKRGVLCMANDGSHTDCSTQFFVLLQPAPWMAQKYVAFGQLIDGEETLKAIENVPTWYESPTLDIIMYRAGILNLECQDIRINPTANEYIQGHIENLFVLGEKLYESLLEKVFLEIEFRRVAKLEQSTGEEETEKKLAEEGGVGKLHHTARFMRKKEDIEKQLQKNQDDHRSSRGQSDVDNNDFDVEEYEFNEPEEKSYQHGTSTTGSIIIKPEIPFYIPLTDVLYPGEVDSTYDLKKFLKGDYCLESDLQITSKNTVPHKVVSFPSELFDLFDSASVSQMSLDSVEEKEIKKYLKAHGDRVSFSGAVIKGIAKGVAKYNIFEGARKSSLVPDEILRRFRIASDRRWSSKTQDEEVSYKHEKKVSIQTSVDGEEPHKIKRRQTGFVRAEDLETIEYIQKKYSHDYRYDDLNYDNINEEEGNSYEETSCRKVRIDPDISSDTNTILRRATGYVRSRDSKDDDGRRTSVLTRLMDNVKDDEPGPTLKTYKPFSETRPTHLLTSPTIQMKSDLENTKEKYIRQSFSVEQKDSYERMMNLQHGKKYARKISSDYINTIDNNEHKTENSIRTLEFARTRPSMTVSQYQLKNQNRDGVGGARKSEQKKGQLEVKTVGLRLPGDSPLYSVIELKNIP